MEEENIAEENHPRDDFSSDFDMHSETPINALNFIKSMMERLDMIEVLTTSLVQSSGDFSSQMKVFSFLDRLTMSISMFETVFINETKKEVSLYHLLDTVPEYREFEERARVIFLNVKKAILPLQLACLGETKTE